MYMDVQVTPTVLRVSVLQDHYWEIYVYARLLC